MTCAVFGFNKGNSSVGEKQEIEVKAEILEEATQEVVFA